MGAHTEIHGADIGEVGRANSIGLERINEPTLNMFVNGANSFPMKSDGFSMGPIWIPMHSIGFANRFHMNSNAYHMDFFDSFWIQYEFLVVSCLADSW